MPEVRVSEVQERLAAERYELRAAERHANARTLRDVAERARSGHSLEAVLSEAPEAVDHHRLGKELKRVQANEGQPVPYIEAVIGADDSVPVRFLRAGARAADAVCRLVVGGPQGWLGTGWMLTPELLVTNHHVLGTPEDARGAVAQFGYEEDQGNKASVDFELDPDRFFHAHQGLDYAIVAVRPTSRSGQTLTRYGWLKPRRQMPSVPEAVNVIQHPGGARKRVATRESRVVDVQGDFLHYSSDTERGSSGSPVFDDDWQVIALHHAGVPRRDAQGNLLAKDGQPYNGLDRSRIDWVANEGVLIQRILDDARRANPDPAKQAMLNTEGPPPPEVSPPPEGPAARPAAAPSSTPPDYIPADDPAQRDAWYAGLEASLTPQERFGRLHDLLERTHTRRLPYTPERELYPLDRHPDGKLRSLYTGTTYTLEELIAADRVIERARHRFIQELLSREAFREISLEALTEAAETSHPYNCEHVVPQSWFDGAQPMRGDLHHLFACDTRCNSFRGDLAFREFKDHEEAVAAGCGRSDDGWFEPAQGKGPAARATLYFLLRYPGVVTRYDAQGLQTLLAWHAAEPVQVYERHRNALIHRKQGNRNPLIDHPEWAGQIDFTRGLG